MTIRSLLGGLVALLLLALPTSVCAAPATIGQLAPPDPPGSCNSTLDMVQDAVASGPSYAVPPGYTTLTSWSTNASPGLGQTLTMKVFRPVGDEEYTVVGHDGPRFLNPEVLNTFPVSIPVQTGDLVGLSTIPAPNFFACLFYTENSMDSIDMLNKPLADGATATFPEGVARSRVNVSATVATAPAIVAISPVAGSVSGGTAVTIAGHDLSGATAVRFGPTSASAFSVSSDNEIHAVAPPSSTAGTVDVTVTTAAGTTPAIAGDLFTYTASSPASPPSRPGASKCVVPNLRGKTLKADRKKLKKAGCKLGKVNGRKGKSSRVKKQHPKSGKTLPRGSKVSITLGGPPKR